MSQISENVRFALWRAGGTKDNWLKRLARILGGNVSSARRLLVQGEISTHDLRAISEDLGFTDEELRFSNLVEQSGVDVVRENLISLLNALPRGGKARLARHLDVHPTTISKWLSGTQGPTSRHCARIEDFLGLRPGTLREEAIFLSLSPSTLDERKGWLIERIDEMSSEKLALLFPALEMLLSER